MRTVGDVIGGDLAGPVPWFILEQKPGYGDLYPTPRSGSASGSPWPPPSWRQKTIALLPSGRSEAEGDYPWHYDHRHDELLLVGPI